MVQRTHVVMIDDLDGSTDDLIVTFSFAVDGQEYEIDLKPGHLEEFYEVTKKFVAAARYKRRAKPPALPPKKLGGSTYTQAVRKWAEQEHISVNARGRIPQHIIEAYEKATAKT